MHSMGGKEEKRGKADDDKDLRKEEKTKCRDAMYKSMGVFKYLVKELLKFTFRQIQISYLIWMFSV